MAVKIFADAASNLFKNILKDKNLDIKIMNVHLRIDEKEYLCYDDIDDIKAFNDLYYEALKDGKKIATSLVTPGDYEEAFKKEVEKGNKVICFTMAQGISGTYQSACLARDDVNAEKGEKVVEVIDSMTAGFGEGLQAIHAYELAQEGKSFEEIIKECEEFKHYNRSDFTVDDIKYLLKTGRVGKTAARFINFLNIKVLLKRSEKSTIAFAGTARGKANAIKELADRVDENINRDIKQVIYISHCNCVEDAEKLKKLLEDVGLSNIEIYDYDYVSASHIGPGSLAVFYIGKEAY